LTCSTPTARVVITSTVTLVLTRVEEEICVTGVYTPEDPTATMTSESTYGRWRRGTLARVSERVTASETVVAYRLAGNTSSKVSGPESAGR